MSTIALASPHRTATELGLEVIRAGGTAVEAALTTAVALTVVYPHQCSLGGDLVALVRDPAGVVHSYVSVGATAAGLEVATVPMADGRIVGRGAHTITVPGIVAGWQAIAGEAFAGALRQAFLAASRLADTGIPVSPGLGRALVDTWPIIGGDAGMRQLFGVDGGGHLADGSLLRQSALARTLAALAASPGDYYVGEIAGRLVQALGSMGSALTADDFAAHRVDRTEPLTRDLAGRRWWVAPPPSQGIAFLAVRASTDAASTLELSIRSAAVRDAELAEPGGPELTLDHWLAAMQAAALGPDVRIERPSGDTVGITAMDDAGWVVSIVQSTYQTFGSGLADPATGVVFHNRGSAFSAEPAHPAFIAPGARPPHTLTPVLADGGDGGVVSLACQGGRAQPWILAQLADSVIDPAQPLAATLARDRWIFGGKDIGCDEPTILVEADAVPADVQAAADRRGWANGALARQVDIAGHVQVVRSTSSGLEAGTDPRADGLAVVAAAT